MPLKFQSRIDKSIPVDLTGVTPDACRGWSLLQFNAHPVWQGNRRVALGELFAIAGDATSDEWHFAGELHAVHNLAAGMAAGTIIVEGNIGRHAGATMRGGDLRIAGSAGDWPGCEMHGGTIRIAGDAGDYAGGAYIGSRVGMRGGTFIVMGSAGEHTGEAMRRGLIAIAGDTGPRCGYRMRAGTIAVLGTAERHIGAEMRRGTICVLGAPPPTLLPTFAPACTLHSVAIDLILRQLVCQGVAAAANHFARPLALASGDLLAGGRGEIYCPAG